MQSFQFQGGDASQPPPPPPKETSNPQSYQTPHWPTATDRPHSQAIQAPPIPPPLPPGQDAAPPHNAYDMSLTSPLTAHHTPPSSTQANPSHDPGASWLPASVIEKSTTQLHELLSTPSLLAALTLSQPPPPPYTPPDLPLNQSLATNLALSQQLLTLHADLLALHRSLTTHLLHLHSLHTRWRAKQEELDRALAPWSPAGLYQNLAAREREAGGWTEGLERSFLEGPQDKAGDGTWGEREVLDWVRRYREGRRVYWGRRERRERWDEGRVGGWR